MALPPTSNSTLGQIGIIPGADTFLSYGICKMTGSHSRHAIIGVGGTSAVSADPDGVHLIDYEAMVRTGDYPKVLWSNFDQTWTQAARVAQFALNQVGKPYAFWDDALIALERIFHHRAPEHLRKFLEDDGQWQCAELATASMAAGGTIVFPDDDLIGDAAPGDYEALYIRKHWHTLDEWTSVPLAPWKRK